jgi:hypothetical protein
MMEQSALLQRFPKRRNKRKQNHPAVAMAEAAVKSQEAAVL